MVIEFIFYVLILLTAFPVGKLLAWLCSDELRKDRKYFLYFIYLLVPLCLISLFFYLILALTFLYMIIVLWILIKK